MKWPISQIPKSNIIHVETSGTVSVEPLNQMVREVLQAAERHNSELFCVDHRKVHIAMSIVDTYDRPKVLDRLGVTRNSRIAQVCDQKDLKKFQFLETVSVNNGYQVRVFQDITLAVGWLRGQNGSSA